MAEHVVLSLLPYGPTTPSVVARCAVATRMATAVQKEQAVAAQARITASHHWLSSLCEDAKRMAADVFAKSAERLGADVTDGLRDELRAALSDVVQRTREVAHARGAQDVADELAAVFPKAKGLKLSTGAAPQPVQVRTYVLNAVDIALELVRDAIEEGTDESREMLRMQGWRGSRVAVTEVTKAYDASRRAAFDDLARNYDDSSLGFVLLKDEDELDGEHGRSISHERAKEEDRHETVVLALRWGAILDKRTCLRCRELDGRMTIVALPFADGPPLHSNCRCAVSLWAIPWTWTDDETGEQGT